MPYSSSTDYQRLSDAAAKASASDKELLRLAQARFKIAADAESEHRRLQLEDLEFLVGEQWPDDTKAFRKSGNQPCLTINRLPAIKSQIVNEQRAQRPTAVINPVGNGADEDTADIWEGMLRHINVNSDAEIAIDCGFEHMVAGGKGYAEICADYLPGRTFDQELYIRRIKNPFTVYCDPSCVAPDESDANYKFQICDYPFEEYRQEWPDSELASATDMQSVGDNYPMWGTHTTIRVAKYWHKVWQREELFQLKDGQVVTSTEYKLRTKELKDEQKPPIVQRRKWRYAKIVCSTINAIEALETYNFPGTIGYIPLVPFIAEDFDVNGKRHLYGIVRHAKDPQRAINYFRSYAAEQIALSTKAPWVGWKGQFTDPKWKNANIVQYAFLEADTITTSGTPAPSLPVRNQYEPPIQAALAFNQAVDGDLKAVTGIYEPSLGQNKSDQSGKAIDLLQRQGGLTNLNYTDNLSRTLRHIARIILDAGPFIYDAPRVQRIIDPDGSTKQVIVHSGREKAADALKSPDVKDVYDLHPGVGTYDVVIDVGPSFQTRREAAFNQQMQLAQADKTGTILKVASDIIVGNSDAPGAREISERLKRTIPPDVLGDDAKSDPKVALQQAVSTIRQLEQQNQALMQENMRDKQTINEKLLEQQTDIRVAEIRAAASVEAAGLAAKIDAARLDFERFVHQHDVAHEAALRASGATDGGANQPEPAEPAEPAAVSSNGGGNATQ